MPPIPSELLTVWLTAAAHLVVLGCAIFGVVAALKHSAHALHWSCLDGPAGQVVLRVGPILAGAAIGPAVFAMPVAVAVLLGSIAGAQSRGLYRLARKIGGEKIGALLMTSEHRERQPPPDGPQGGGPWEGPWAAMFIVPGLGLEQAEGTGLALLLVGLLVVGGVFARALGVALRPQRPPPAPDRGVEDLMHELEVERREAARAEQAAAAARVDAIDAIDDPREKHKAILDEYQRRHPGSR